MKYLAEEGLEGEMTALQTLLFRPIQMTMPQLLARVLGGTLVVLIVLGHYNAQKYTKTVSPLVVVLGETRDEKRSPVLMWNISRWSTKWETLCLCK